MKVMAEVVTPWETTAEGELGPKIMSDYAVDAFEDITRQLYENITPSPNLYMVRILCEDTVLTQIELDPVYDVVTSWSV